MRTVAEMSEVTRDAWTQDMQSETEFQQEKARRRLMQTHTQGLVRDDEIGDKVQFQREKEALAKLDAANVCKTKRAGSHRHAAQRTSGRSSQPHGHVDIP